MHGRELTRSVAEKPQVYVWDGVHKERGCAGRSSWGVAGKEFSWSVAGRKPYCLWVGVHGECDWYRARGGSGWVGGHILT